MTWPAGRSPNGSAPTVTPRASTPGPPPAGRGQWRVMLYPRIFTTTANFMPPSLGELPEARSRRLDLAWNAPAQFIFTVDGHSAVAAQIVELMSDVVAWRWDENQGRDVAMFRGVVTQSEDQIEESHVVNFTCHDYLSVHQRRYFTTGYSVTQRGQDLIANDILGRGFTMGASAGTSFAPGNFLPLGITFVNPDGTGRTAGGPLRDRSYLPSQNVFEAFDNLARVQGGFDYDTRYVTGNGLDSLRLFYPYQGLSRTDVALVYGSTVSALTRSVNSADYANYWRIIGDNGSSDPAAPQLFSEAWNADANDITRIPIGLWASTDNSADVNQQATLDEQAAGHLALSGIVVPSYSLTLRPGFYTYGAPNVGDVVPLVINSGRLRVNTTVRVLGISYQIGDDGQEDVTLTVGRPKATLGDMILESRKDTAALTRR